MLDGEWEVPDKVEDNDDDEEDPRMEESALLKVEDLGWTTLEGLPLLLTLSSLTEDGACVLVLLFTISIRGAMVIRIYTNP